MEKKIKAQVKDMEELRKEITNIKSLLSASNNQKKELEEQKKIIESLTVEN